MDGIDTSKLNLRDIPENNEFNYYTGSGSDMLEVTASDLDMINNPEKYMEMEIRKIEEEEKAIAEAQDIRNGQPLDIQTWELIQREREERKKARIEACMAKWSKKIQQWYQHLLFYLDNYSKK